MVLTLEHSTTWNLSFHYTFSTTSSSALHSIFPAPFCIYFVTLFFSRITHINALPFSVSKFFCKILRLLSELNQHATFWSQAEKRFLVPRYWQGIFSSLRLPEWLGAQECCYLINHLSFIFMTLSVDCRSLWKRGLRRGSAAARWLGLWVRIPPAAWAFVCCECCVLSGRGLCIGLITRPGESYPL